MSELAVADPRCLPTTLGSLPYTDIKPAMALILRHTPHIPAWVQLPRRNAYENMMEQYMEGLPGRTEKNKRSHFDTSRDSFEEEMTRFYSLFMKVASGDLHALESFAIMSERSVGFNALIAELGNSATSPVIVKGQVTGPFTLGVNTVDQNDRLAYYDPQLKDVIVKIVALKALWQIKHLKQFHTPLTIWMDEPALLGFGTSLYISISRQDVLQDLNEVAGMIHKAGATTGVHCEENTDWSLLMEADLDILSFDAYNHFQAITLYPKELKRFFDRGGCLAWGIVPTLSREAAAKETVSSLLKKFDDGVKQLTQKGFDRDLILRRALITPSCGAGSLSVELAQRVYELLSDLSDAIRLRDF